MTALISLGGVSVTPNILKNLVKKADLIIAADKGYYPIEKIGVKPDYIVGDFDSLNIKSIPEDIEVIKYPSEKDLSDAEIAVELAISKNADKIILVNALGYRPDHHFSNIAILAKYPKKTFIIDENWKIMSIKGPDNLILTDLKKNKLISIFPFGKEVKGLSLQGLKYTVKDFDIKSGSRGLSNIITENNISISLKKGILIIFIQQ